MLQILGKVNPSICYSREEDILPIESLQMLKLLAKRARYDDSGDFDDVATIEGRIRSLAKKTVAYQQAPNRNLSYTLGGSGGDTLTNL